MERFDAVIVGAGPAGSSSAFRLARAGVRVLIVEKSRFPRDKPCGGAISSRAMRELPIDPQPVEEHVADQMELSFRGGRPFVRGGHGALAYLTQRRRLDRFLAEQAAHAGAELRHGVQVGEISPGGLRVDGQWIQTEILIGADGANGPSARALELAGERIYGVALEGNLPYALTDPQRWEERVVIELGTIPGGYCWIFPKGDHINVGVGGWETAGSTLRSHLKAFCERRRFDHSKLEGVRGYRLPARRPHAALARGRALLVGDAAGLVDPLWGDGMYSAFVSSRLATKASLDLLSGKADALDPYARSIVSELAPMMRFAWNAKVALDRAPRLSLAALTSTPGWRTVANILRGEIVEPLATDGLAGIAMRGFESFAGRAGWPGVNYRAEADPQAV